MWNLILKNNTNELICKTERLTNIENKLMVTKGETWQGGINQELGMNTHTLLYKIDNQQGPTV